MNCVKVSLVCEMYQACKEKLQDPNHEMRTWLTFQWFIMPSSMFLVVCFL